MKLPQKLRLALAGRRAVLVGLLMMLCVPLTGPAQAAPASVPSAVTAPTAPDPCEKIDGPAKDYCEAGRDKDEKTDEEKEREKKNCDLIVGDAAKEACKKEAEGDTKPSDPCKRLDKGSAAYEQCVSGETNDPLSLTDDCKPAPNPDVPGTGVAGWFDSGPDEAPEPRDPSSKNAEAHIYEQYGYAGLTFNTYDLGCGGVVRNPEASTENGFANLVFSWPRAWTALTVVLRQYATSNDLFDSLNPVIERATHAVRDAVFSPWIGTSLLLLGIVIIWQARKANLPDAMQRVVWALMVMTIATGVASYPVAASKFADSAIDTTISAIDQTFAEVDLNGSDDKDTDSATQDDGGLRPAGYAAAKAPDAELSGDRAQAQTAHGNMLVRNVLYQQWLRGTFGDDKSAVAKKYGMELFDSQALTWREARLPSDERRVVVLAKQEKFREIAAKVQKEDPTAYGYLTGKTSGRLGAAGLTSFQSVGTNTFSMIADVIIVTGKLLIKLLVVMLPALAVVGLHRAASSSVKTAFSSAMAVCVNIPLFTVGAGVHLLVVRELGDKSVDLPGWFKALVMILVWVVLWKMLRPLTRLTAMINPGHNYLDGAADAVSGPGKLAKKYGKYYLGTRYLRKLMKRQTEAIEDISEAVVDKQEDSGSSYWGDGGSPFASTPPALEAPSGDGGGALEPLHDNVYDGYDMDSDRAGRGEFFRPGHAGDPDADDVWGDGPVLERVDKGTHSSIRPYNGAADDDGAPAGPGPQAPFSAPADGGAGADIPSPRADGAPYYGADGTVPPAASMPDSDAPQPESLLDEPRVVPPSVDGDGGIVYTIYNPATGGYQLRDERPDDDGGDR